MAAAAQPVVPRRWIGVPDSAWNPTLMLMVVVLLGFSGLAAGMLGDYLSPWLTIAGLSVFYYLVFTVLHESTHGLAHRNRTLNNALGRIAGFALLLPYPLFRAAHLAHHSHTNDPSHDPDLFVARHPRWLAPLWFLVTPLYYRVLVYRGALIRKRGARLETMATEAAIVGVIVAAILAGHSDRLLQIWVIPTILAILWLALVFDLLPHHPHTTQERYYDTRIYPGRVLNVLLLGQNYHLIHHLWTTIPWYRYEPAFREIEHDLRARGAPVGWRRLAERAVD